MTAGIVISRRTAFFISAMVLLGMLFLAMPALGADGLSLDVKKAELDDYPDIELIVQMPDSARYKNKAFDSSQFELTENGIKLSDFESTPLNSAKGRGATVLIMDTSGSMAGQPIEDAKAAAKTFVSLLKPNEQLAILLFSDEIMTLSRFGDSRANLGELIDNIEAKGNTRLNEALTKASELLQETKSTPKNIVVLSDGRDSGGNVSPEAAREEIFKSGAFMSAVALTTKEYDPEYLKKLCADTGGSYFETTDSKTLEDLYLKLASQIYNQYAIKFRSLEPGTAALEYQISLNVNGIVANGSRSYKNPMFTGQSEKKAVGNDSESFNLAVVKDTGQSKVLLPYEDKVSGFIFFMSLIVAFLSIVMIMGVILSILFKPRTSLGKQVEYMNQRWKRFEDKVGKDKAPERAMTRKVLSATKKLAEKRGYEEALGQLLERADVPLRVAEFIVLHIAFILAVSAVMMMTTSSLMIIITMVFIAAIAPLLYLQNRVNQKTKVFEENLPDTLRVISSSLRSGYSFSQALEVASKEDIPEISSEFHKVSTESRLGLPMEQALENMATRIQSEGVNWLVMAVKVQREVGGNLAEILDILAKTIQERDAVRRQVKALTAEGRISAIILVALPFAIGVFMMFANPGYLVPLFTTTMGLVMMGTTTILMSVGIIWLRRIITIEV